MDGDDDGFLFGDSCKRRIFFPGSKRSTSVAPDLHGTHQCAAARDPLQALGLFTSSPYKELRWNARQLSPLARQDDEDMYNNARSVRARRAAGSPGISPWRSIVTDPRSRGARAAFDPPWTMAAATACRVKPFESHVSSVRYRGYSQEVAYKAIYSPQQVHDCRRRADITRGNTDWSSTVDHFGEDGSTTLFLQKIREDEKVIAEEVARLRRGADASVMLRCFWRCSGVPLDHIFATAARAYRRSRLRPALLFWHASAASEIRRINLAATCIQRSTRVFLARRVAAQGRPTRDSAEAAAAVRVIHRWYRVQKALKSGPDRAARTQQRQKIDETGRNDKAALARRDQGVASVAIQAAWRAAIGRAEGAERARRKLRVVLADLGGGQGRMHRAQDCGVIAGCLEHATLSRACEIALRLPVRSTRRMSEVLFLLLRCRLILDARRSLREEMKVRWTRLAEAFSALKAGLDVARKEAALRQGQSKRAKDKADEEQLERNGRESWTANAKRRLRDSHQRQRIEIDLVEERGRERHEGYLMWREETRQQDITKKALANRSRREAEELVLMRREELLTREAWAMVDETAKHAWELWEHGGRISRLLRQARPAYEEPEGKRSLGNGTKIICPVQGNERKPEALILNGFGCVIDGRRAKVSVTLRPSRAAMLVFEKHPRCAQAISSELEIMLDVCDKQTAALRVTRRELDAARKCVAHWGARCRVDAATAAKVRGELFRLRCKTRTERRSQAAKVSAAKSAAEASIVQLKGALHDARRATTAHATALAEALGVNPPKNLLARRVPNEHRDRLSVRDVTAGGCTYGSRGLGVPSQSAPTTGADGKAAKRVDGRRGCFPDRLSWCSPHKPAVERATDSAPEKRELPRVSPDAARDATFSQGSRRARLAVARPNASRCGLSSGGAGLLGWNREWCRSVDAWCRNATARSRSRLAGEAVRSARRLHWLAGRAAAGGSGFRDIGGASVGGRSANVRLGPSEIVGAEGWAALAAFGDVADLLEIVGSTAELVVSVEVDVLEMEQIKVGATEQWQQQREDEVAVQDTEQEQLRPRAIGFEEFGHSAAPLREKCLVSNKRDSSVGDGETTDLNEAQHDLSQAPSSGETEGFLDEAVVRRTKRGSPNAATNGATDQGGQEETLASDTALEQLSDRAINRAAFISGQLTGSRASSEMVSTVVVKKRRHPPVSHRSEMIAVIEERDTDLESLSDEGSEVERGDKKHAEAKTSRHGALQGEIVGTACFSDACLAGAEDGKPASGLDHDYKFDGGVAIPMAPVASGRLVLAPDTVETCLGIPTLSAFVLQATRGTQQSAFESLPPFGMMVGLEEREDIISAKQKILSPPPGLPADAAHAYPLTPASKGWTTNTGTISETEKLGLADAVKTLVLPRLRISSTSKRLETKARPGKRPTFRLRLEQSAEEGGRISKFGRSNTAKAASATGTLLAATANTFLPVTTRPERERSIARARRYVQNPIYRWAGRADGRRCLLSCSAGPSGGIRPVFFSSSLEALPPKGGGGRAQAKGRPGRRALYLDATIVPDTRVESMDEMYVRSSFGQQVQHRRFVVVAKVPCTAMPIYRISSMSSNTDRNTRRVLISFAPERPLCRNCGRRALQRLSKTNLLVQDEALLSRLDRAAKTGTEMKQLDCRKLPLAGESSETDATDRTLLAPEGFGIEMLQRSKSIAGSATALGRPADWACGSGVMLCATCLGALRSSETSLRRL